MKKIIQYSVRTLRNFLVINVLGVAPILLAMNLFTPDVLVVRCKSDHQLEMRVGESVNSNGLVKFDKVANFEQEGDSRIAKIYFGNGLDWCKVNFKFSGENLAATIQSISIIKHTIFKSNIPKAEFLKLFKHQVPVTASDKSSGILSFTSASGEFVLKNEGTATVKCSPYRLTLDEIEKKWHKRIIGIELLFVVLSLAFCFYKDTASNSDLFKLSILVAGCAAVFVGFAVPLQIFYSNRGAYTFASLYLLKDLFIVFVFVFLVWTLSLWGLGKCFGRWPHVLNMAALVYEYFLVGPLMKGAPALNGGIAFFGTPELIHRDFAVAGVVALLFVVGYHWLKSVLSWLGIGFIVMCGAFVTDAMINPQQDRLTDENCHVSAIDIARSIRHSPFRNVYLICLDSVRSDISAELFKTYPELAKMYQGFTIFQNNIGMYPATIYGMPGFMLGRYARVGETPQAYMDEITGEESFVGSYVNQGKSVWCMMGAARQFFTNQIGVSQTSERNGTKGVEQSGLFWRPDTIPPLNIFEVTRFKLTPFWYKGTMLSRTGMRASDTKTFKRESILFPYVENAPLDSSLSDTLQCYHTYGTHSPINIDRNGNYLANAQNTDTALEDMNYYVLKRTGELFQKLKAKDLYDKSFIVVLADHGNGDSSHPVLGGNDIPGHAVPLLMVKPINATNSLAFVNVPTSHQRVYDLMGAARDRDLTAEEICSMLRQEKRCFVNQESYYKLGKKYLVDASGFLHKENH